MECQIVCLPASKEILNNLRQVRRHCMQSIQMAEEPGDDREAELYREQLLKLNALIESMGGKTQDD